MLGLFKSKVEALEEKAKAATSAIANAERELADASAEFERSPSRDALERKRRAATALEHARTAADRANDQDEMLVARVEAEALARKHAELEQLEASLSQIESRADVATEAARKELAPFVAKIVAAFDELRKASEERVAIEQKIAAKRAELGLPAVASNVPHPVERAELRLRQFMHAIVSHAAPWDPRSRSAVAIWKIVSPGGIWEHSPETLAAAKAEYSVARKIAR